DRYGLKGTFNINTGKYRDKSARRGISRMTQAEAISLYKNSGHEVAIHSLTHPFLDKMSGPEIIYEIAEDRRNIENDFGCIARGMAYPFGTYNNLVMDVLEKCGIVYSRTCKSTYKFEFPENWMTLHPTCHHNADNLMELAEKFVQNENSWQVPEMFYLWGHSYEFDSNNSWKIIEEFAKYIGGHKHIWYATNIEIYDYVKAYESLVTSFDQKIIHNPTSTDVWVTIDREPFCIKAGETLCLESSC
ncbi:MAG: polysaccharide deacetylase family protein, partial [Clostridia bacterium]|nr:polysaccharide deacetylase family protein [Clostridia bacterium]